MEALTIENLSALLVTYGLRIVGSIVIFFVGKKLAHWLTSFITTLIKKNNQR
ncbi:MAG: mechanosensitive ion channel family protein [Campylobacteraceae bacterium]